MYLQCRKSNSSGRHFDFWHCAGGQLRPPRKVAGGPSSPPSYLGHIGSHHNRRSRNFLGHRPAPTHGPDHSEDAVSQETLNSVSAAIPR